MIAERDETWLLLLDWSGSPQQPFGHYWFFVDGVKVGKAMLEWNVRILRYLQRFVR